MSHTTRKRLARFKEAAALAELDALEGQLIAEAEAKAAEQARKLEIAAAVEKRLAELDALESPLIAAELELDDETT